MGIETTKKWLDEGYELIGSINLSSKQLENESIISDIKNALDSSKLEPKYLELEITESTMMKNEKKSIEMLNKICYISLIFVII